MISLIYNYYKQYILIHSLIKIPLFLYLFSVFLFSESNKNVESKIYLIDGKKYISASEFANIHSIRTIFYDDKEKLEFRFPKHKVVISPYSSFVKVNDIIFHMSLPVIYDGDDYFLPVKPFIMILNKTDLPNTFLDSSEQFIITKAPIYNINDLSIINKINGTIINVSTTKQFDQNIIAASITRAGWFNLTIPGGLLDSINITESPTIDPVIKTRCFQSKESAQLSFLLKSKVDDFEIITEKNKIIISLRVAMAENANKIREMRNRWLLDNIVIDAGHGGKDPGAIGYNGLKEKTVTLDIAKELGKLIEKNLGVKVIYTREEDVFLPLWKRTKIANDAGGKLFISIHANAAKQKSVKGFETFLLRPGKTKDAIDVAQRENEVIAMEEHYHQYEQLSNDKLILYTMAQSSFMKESEFFASEIQKQLDKVLTSPNRGVKQAGFQVLVGASMPNVLIEAGFLSNDTEGKLLSQTKYRKKIAHAIFISIVNFKDKYESNIIGE